MIRLLVSKRHAKMLESFASASELRPVRREVSNARELETPSAGL